MSAARDFIINHEASILNGIALIIVWFVLTYLINEKRNAWLFQACKEKNYRNYKKWLRLGASLHYESGKSGTKPLMAACESGALDIVQDIVSLYPKLVHDHDNEGKTPTLYALESNHIDIMKYLLENKARVDDPSDDGSTPLITAAKLGKIDCVEYLLSKNASIKWKTVEGLTALMTVIRHQSGKPECLPIVKLLVKRKCPLDTKLGKGWTVLMEACSLGDLEVVEYLISEGANVSDKTEDEISPFLAACQGGHASVIRLLTDKYRSKIDRNDDNMSLIYATVSGRIESVKAVIESGRYRINATTKEENLTALLLSLDNDSEEISLYLLDQPNIDFSTKTSNEWNVFFYAADYGHKEVCRRLVEKGVDLSHQDSEGWTALMIAVRSNQSEIVKEMLLKVTPSIVNMKQTDGWTALAIAVAMDCTDIVKMLIDHGADVNSKQDPLAIFSEIRNSLYRRMLAFKCNGDAQCPLIVLAVLCENIEIINALCIAGADLKAKTSSGYDAIAIARRSRKKKELLETLSKYKPQRSDSSSWFVNFFQLKG